MVETLLELRKYWRKIGTNKSVYDGARMNRTIDTGVFDYSNSPNVCRTLILTLYHQMSCTDFEVCVCNTIVGAYSNDK